MTDSQVTWTIVLSFFGVLAIADALKGRWKK